jgi:hypothetical protein
MGSSEGMFNLTYFDPANHAFTGAVLELPYSFQRSQNDWKKPVTILGHSVNDTDEIHEEMLGMIKAFPPKLLNQLIRETKTSMNQRLTSTYPSNSQRFSWHHLEEFKNILCWS